MHPDVLDLRAFYYRTPLGRSAQRVLQEALRAIWPETRDLTVVGFGFAAPMLRPFLADARRVVALMPGPQGVMPWPAGGRQRLGPGRGDPLADRGRHHRPADRRPRPRDLRPARRSSCRRSCACSRPAVASVFIVPNRSGLWARRDVTPFGNGRPYSFGQLETVLAPAPPQRRAPRRRALLAAVAPPLLGADRLLLGAHRPPLRAARRRRRPARRGGQAGLRPPAVDRQQGRRARSARRARRPRRPQARAGARPRPQRGPAPAARLIRRTAARPKTAQLHCRPDIATLPSLCYHSRRFRWGRGAPFRATMAPASSGGGVTATEGCQCPAQLH